MFQGSTKQILHWEIRAVDSLITFKTGVVRPKDETNKKKKRPNLMRNTNVLDSVP